MSSRPGCRSVKSESRKIKKRSGETMNFGGYFCVLLFLSLLERSLGQNPYIPQQIHLAYGSEFVVFRIKLHNKSDNLSHEKGCTLIF